MQHLIRKMILSDKSEVIEMMKKFYSSPAVLTCGSEEIFLSDFENCINNNPYIDGFVFECENKLQGYAMIAKSFSTEFGKHCIWIEDLYIKNEYRGHGIGTNFINYIEKEFPNSIFRLEVEDENETAIKVYKKCGFEFLNYKEMIKK